jgi:AP-3 complex subunit delta
MLCELARRNPQDYLVLAPQLFHLLTTSSNNWMLIKIVKLVSSSPLVMIQSLTASQFGSLCPHESRLIKKLATPITELISTTPAISLLYECVHTCIIGGMLQGRNGDDLARTCVTKLSAFLQDPDHNCKSTGIQALNKRMSSCGNFSEIYRTTSTRQNSAITSSSCSRTSGRNTGECE